MKLLISGLAMLLIVILLCIANQMYLTSSLEAFIVDLDVIAEEIQYEKWEPADKKLEGTLASWFEKKGYYMSVMLHEHIHDVEAALIELQCNIEDRDTAESNKSLRSARLHLENLIGDDTLSLTSLL